MNNPMTWTVAVRRAPLAALSMAAFALAGCAGFSRDGGFDPVAKETQARLGQDVRWARTEEESAKSAAQVAALLQHPLSAEDAVQVALLSNRSLQASFEKLGISEADLVASGRLPNPQFTLRHASVSAQYDIEETLSFNLLSLLTAPYAHAIERRRFAEAQSAAVIAVVQLANDTRRAFYAAVAAQESVKYLDQVQTAADAGAELARRMVAAGNWNLLDQTREQAFRTDAAQRLSRARWALDSTRERLRRLLGLAEGQPPLRLAEQLPELPQSIEPLPDVEAAALQSRIDLRLQRMQLDELAHRLGLTKATRFVNVLDLGPTRILQGAQSQPYERGYQISLEIPIFDGGGPRVRRAEALYSEAIDRFAQAAIDARSQIREAYAGYRSSFEIARQQRDEVLPMAKLISAQDLLRYNASLISVFDLLSDARSQIAGVDACIQSARDFWMAKAELDTTLLGNPTP